MNDKVHDHLPRAHEGKNADGSVDVDKAIAGVGRWNAAFKNGTYTCKDLEDKLDLNAADVSYLHYLFPDLKVDVGDELFVVVRKKN